MTEYRASFNPPVSLSPSTAPGAGLLPRREPEWGQQGRPSWKDASVAACSMPPWKPGGPTGASQSVSPRLTRPMRSSSARSITPTTTMRAAGTPPRTRVSTPPRSTAKSEARIASSRAAREAREGSQSEPGRPRTPPKKRTAASTSGSGKRGLAAGEEAGDAEVVAMGKVFNAAPNRWRRASEGSGGSGQSCWTASTRVGASSCGSNSARFRQPSGPFLNACQEEEVEADEEQPYHLPNVPSTTNADRDPAAPPDLRGGSFCQEPLAQQGFHDSSSSFSPSGLRRPPQQQQQQHHHHHQRQQQQSQGQQPRQQQEQQQQQQLRPLARRREEEGGGGGGRGGGGAAGRDPSRWSSSLQEEELSSSFEVTRRWSGPDADLQRLGEELGALRIENCKLREQLANADRMDRSECDGDEEVEELKEENQRLRRALSDLETQRDREVAESRSQLKQLVSEVEALRESLRSAENNRSREVGDAWAAADAAEAKHQRTLQTLRELLPGARGGSLSGSPVKYEEPLEPLQAEIPEFGGPHHSHHHHHGHPHGHRQPHGSDGQRRAHSPPRSSFPGSFRRSQDVVSQPDDEAYGTPLLSSPFSPLSRGSHSPGPSGSPWPSGDDHHPFQDSSAQRSTPESFGAARRGASPPPSSPYRGRDGGSPPGVRRSPLPLQ